MASTHVGPLAETMESTISSIVLPIFCAMSSTALTKVSKSIFFAVLSCNWVAVSVLNLRRVCTFSLRYVKGSKYPWLRKPYHYKKWPIHRDPRTNGSTTALLRQNERDGCASRLLGFYLRCLKRVTFLRLMMLI